MSEFELFFALGHKHVLDLNAYDHVLFLGALALTYQVNQWGRLLGLVTLFTAGHTISILIAYYGLFQPPVQLVELLIPISIMAAAMNNIYQSLHVKYKDHLGVLFAVTLVFGLIHGFGFGRYFNQIADQATYKGFLAFALGIEWAQLLVVVGMLLLSYFTERLLRLSRKDWIVLMSGVIIGLTLPMLLERI
jgi:hypothetical protein